MIGLNTSSWEIIVDFLISNSLMLINGSFLGILIGAMFKDTYTTSIMLVVMTMPLALFAGFIGNKESYPVWIAWI
jgi:hypothetical protein